MSYHVQHSRLIFGIVFGLLLVTSLAIFLIHRNGEYTTITVEESDFVRSVTVSGEVVPQDEVTLAFTSGGRIMSLAIRDSAPVARGQALASLDTSELEASIRQAQADQRLAQAELNALVGASDVSGRTEAVKREALTAMQKAHTVADTQIRTNTDVLFTNIAGARPQVTLAIRNYFIQQAVNQKREVMTQTLKEWQTFITTLETASVTQADLQYTVTKLQDVQSYFELLGQALSDAEPVTGVTEARLSEFRGLVSNARTAIAVSINEVLAAQESLRAVSANVPVQEARIAATQASIDRYQALLNDRTLISPFTGIATNVFVTTGEIVAPNQPIVSLISDGEVMLEAFIPEISIANVSVGNQARVQFDAYGADVILGATVTAIDPQATIKNGIATYKTTLTLHTIPPTIRVGMTTTISIEVARDENKIIVPRSAVAVDGTTATVQILTDKEIETRVVEIGRTDTQGGVEILDGLTVGDIIIVSSNK